MTLTEWAISQANSGKDRLFLFERTVRGHAAAKGEPEPEKTAEEWEAAYTAWRAALDLL